MCYFLDYRLELDGFKPTTTVEKALFSTFKLIAVDEDKLKSLSQESKSI